MKQNKINNLTIKPKNVYFNMENNDFIFNNQKQFWKTQFSPKNKSSYAIPPLLVKDNSGDASVFLCFINVL